ncbi:hypothetical protein WR25_08149 [Diploscapter pachys]|uniref:Uncharacterized protein n=1 Tax=Diploscapter pachys TaxID=2018661 RepID=A0A2A2LTC7_9BILA|nr:hypothetical protein WR25_08149 [Diploscapter pachys]
MSRELQPSFRANANEPFGFETITSDGLCSTVSLCCCRWICRVCCCNSTLNLIDCNYQSIPHLDFTTKALCEIVVKQIGVSQHCDGVDCLRLELLDAGRTLQGRHCLNQKLLIGGHKELVGPVEALFDGEEGSVRDRSGSHSIQLQGLLGLLCHRPVSDLCLPFFPLHPHSDLACHSCQLALFLLLHLDFSHLLVVRLQFQSLYTWCRLLHSFFL